MAFNQPSAKTFTVEEIVKEAHRGTIRIPFFQRNFKWNQRDARLLLDSLLKGYPIGNFLLWKRAAPAGKIALGALEIDAPQLDDALWVVDGQQRITTLANVFSEGGRADPRFRFAYDPLSDAIVPGDQPVPFHVLIDASRLLAWIRDHPEHDSSADKLIKVNTQLRQYQVPVYVVDAEEQVLRDIFHRMNNFGRPMLRSEVFHALHVMPSDKPSLSVRELPEHLHAATSFGLVDEDTVLKALFAIRGSEVSRRLENEFSAKDRDFSSDTGSEATQRTLDALTEAARFLMMDAGVPHFALLPYKYVLVVLARFFAHHTSELHPRQRVLLRRWVWRAVNTRGTGFDSYNSTTRKYASCIVAGEDLDTSIRDLLRLTHPQAPDALPGRVSAAAAKMLFCAMWAKGPQASGREEDDEGGVYTSEALGAAIGDKAQATNALMKLNNKWSGRLGNRTFFFDSDEARSELFERPLWMDEERWKEALGSHALTPEILKETAEDTFCEMREGILLNWMKDFFTRMAEPAVDDAPRLSSLNLDDHDAA